MSDDGDKVMRHARWILESARRVGMRESWRGWMRVGWREWGAEGIGLQCAPDIDGTGIGWAADVGDMDEVEPTNRAAAALILRGLLHDRLVAEAVGEAVEHAAESERRMRWDVDRIVEEAVAASRAEHERRVESVRAELEAAEDSRKKGLETAREKEFEEFVAQTQKDVAGWPEWKKASMGLLWVDRNQPEKQTEPKPADGSDDGK